MKQGQRGSGPIVVSLQLGDRKVADFKPGIAIQCNSKQVFAFHGLKEY